MSNFIYNFPISMLHGFISNPDKVLNDILDFAVYSTNKQYHYEDADEVEAITGTRFYNLNSALRDGEQLAKEHSNNGYPWTGIGHNILWQFKGKDRNDFDKATLLAFLAIKSLIGEKPYYKVTNQSVIFKRMAGYKDSDKYNLPKEIKKFTTRSRFDRIKLELKENWNVVIYATHVRGMYISTTLSLEELAMQAEKNKLRTRQRAQSHAAEEARRKAVETLAAEYPKPQPTPRTEQPHQVQKPPQSYYDNGNDLDF